MILNAIEFRRLSLLFAGEVLFSCVFFTPLSFNLIEDRITRDKRLFDNKPRSPSRTSSCSPHHPITRRATGTSLHYRVLSAGRGAVLQASLYVACCIQPVLEQLQGLLRCGGGTCTAVLARGD